MASEKDTVVLKLELQEAQAKQRIKSLGKDLKKLDGRTKEYKLAVAKLNVENRRLIDTQKSLNSATPILTKKMFLNTPLFIEFFKLLILSFEKIPCLKSLNITALVFV